MDDPYEYGGVFDSWIQEGAVGSETAPAYYTLDVRLKYTKAFPVGEIEFFLDVFNILDKQSATSEQDLVGGDARSEEHTSELQSLMRISYAVFCLKKNTKNT